MLAGGLGVAACSSNSATDPSDKVVTALKRANLADADVNYDKTERVVHLKGTVDSADDRTRSEQIAERAVGTSGKVLNEVTVKGADTKMADDYDGAIKDRLKALVDNDPDLKQRDISFSMNNGAVEVSGSGATAGEKSRVTDMVRGVAGVRGEANGLQIDPNAAKTGRQKLQEKRPK